MFLGNARYENSIERIGRVVLPREDQAEFRFLALVLSQHLAQLGNHSTVVLLEETLEKESIINGLCR